MSSSGDPSDGSDRDVNDSPRQTYNQYHHYDLDDLRVICTGNGDLLFWNPEIGADGWISMENAPYVQNRC